MRTNDALTGAALLALALAVLWHVQGFPPSPGQPYGAALFPGLVAAGLAVCATLLVVQGLRSGDALVRWGDGMRARRRLGAFAATAGSIGFYIATAEWLGFVVAGALMLATLLASYGVRARLIAPVALGATLAIHTAFFKLLKVPLPWGVLEPIAW